MQWNKSWQSEQVDTCCMTERLCCSLEENLQAERNSGIVYSRECRSCGKLEDTLSRSGARCT